MFIVPLRPVSAQQEVVTLSNQNCRLRFVQYETGLFADIYVNDALLVGGVACQDRNPLVRGAYLGFAGNLTFYDLQGREDPTFTGLGSRFVLVYDA